MRIIKRDCGVSRSEFLFTYNDHIYYTDYDHGACFEYNPLEGRTILRKLYISFKSQNRIFGAIVSDTKNIYLIPFMGKRMYSLDTNSWESKKYELTGIQKKDNSIGALSAHFFDDKIYIISDFEPIVYEFDCKTENVKSYSVNIENQNLDSKEVEGAYYRTSMLLNGKIYMPSCKANLMVIFDTETKETTFKRIGEDHYRYSAVCFADGLYYLAQRKGREIVCWDPEKDTTTLFFRNMPEDDIKYSFSNILCNEKYIIASPLSGRGLYLINRATKEESVLFEEIRCANICCSGKMLYITDLNNNMIIEVDTEDMSYKKNILWLSETITEQLRMSNNLQNGAFLTEKATADLVNYGKALAMV